MLLFRKHIMESILESPEKFSIEHFIHESLHRKYKSSTLKIKRFLQLFESDLNFQLRQKQTPDMQRNLIEAYRVIKEISIEAA